MSGRIEEQRVSEIAIGVGGMMSAADEGHTRRQIGLRLLPFLFLLYIVNFLDRASVAYAAIGMKHDLGFDDSVFGLGFGIFFAGYIILQIPCAILVERWSARKVIAITMVAWGAMTSLTSLVRMPGELYLARFLLGAAEAGFFPAVVVYLSHWFLREDRAKATSNFMSAIPLLVAAVGLFGLAAGPSSVIMAIFLFTLVTVGNAYISVFWSIPTEILSPAIAAASVGLISSVGSIAGFASPYGFAYLNQKTGTFLYGLVALGILALIAAGAIFAVPTVRKSAT